MKIKNLLLISLVLLVTVAFFKYADSRDKAVFNGLKKDNDKKDYCLKHQLDKDLNDDCKAIIRDLKIRGEEYGF